MGRFRWLSYVVFLRNTVKFLVQCADNILLLFMKNQTVTSKRTQGGFTLVEIVAAMVIMAAVAAYAVPRMLGSNDFAAKMTADRVLAALHYAQTLAQRQGVATEVVITTAPNHLVVRYQAGPTVVTFATQNWDGSPTAVADTYDVVLHPDAPVVPTATISYGANGVSTAGAGTYTIAGNGMSFRIKVESTGATHFE